MAWGVELGAYLKVAADNEDVDSIPPTMLARLGDRRIDGVQSAMALQIWSILVPNVVCGFLTHPSTATRTPWLSKVFAAIFFGVVKIKSASLWYRTYSYHWNRQNESTGLAA